MNPPVPEQVAAQRQEGAQDAMQEVLQEVEQEVVYWRPPQLATGEQAVDLAPTDARVPQWRGVPEALAATNPIGVKLLNLQDSVRSPDPSLHHPCATAHDEPDWMISEVQLEQGA